MKRYLIGQTHDDKGNIANYHTVTIACDSRRVQQKQTPDSAMDKVGKPVKRYTLGRTNRANPYFNTLTAQQFSGRRQWIAETKPK